MNTEAFVPLRTGSSSSNSGDAYDVEMSCDLEVIQSAAVAAVPSAQVGYLKSAAKASSGMNNFGDDNDEQLSSELDRSSDIEVIESSPAPAVPCSKVGHQSPSLYSTRAYDIVA